VARNGVEDRVAVIEGDARIFLPLVAPVRIVLANIVSSVIRELLPTVNASLSSSGRAIVSGMLLEERGGMEVVFDAGGWIVADSDHEGQWWSATIARR
jgi:ribosomal protein L11 methyltransferase